MIGADSLWPTIDGREASFGHVHQNALAQLDGFEVGAIGAQRFLVVGAAIGVIEKGARHPAARRHPQIIDAGENFHGISVRPIVSGSTAEPAAKRARLHVDTVD